MSKVIYQMVTDRIVEALKKGQVPWQKPWQRLAGIPVLPCNVASKREYNGINAMLLYMEAAENHYELPVWLTLKQANSLGGGVKAGSRSMPVIFWKQWTPPSSGESAGKSRVEDADAMVRGESGAGEVEERQETIPILRYYAVFNAEQTYGVKPVEALQQRIAKQLQERGFNPVEEADKIVSAAREHLGCKFMERGNKAAYMPKADMVMMPHREMFKEPANFYLTVFHEFVHATGHKDRLKRSGFGGYSLTNKDEYAREELVAEIGACYLANKCGILRPELFENSTSYLQAWMQRLKEDPKLIIAASSQAMRAVEFILHGRQYREDVVASQAEATAELKEESEGVKVG